MKLYQYLLSNQILLGITALAVGAPVVALVASLLNTVIREVLKLLAALTIQKRPLVGYNTQAALIKYLTKHGRSYGISYETYVLGNHWVKPLEKSAKVFFREFDASYRFFIYRGAPLLYRPLQRHTSGNNEVPALFAIRGTVNWEQLLDAAAAYEAFPSKESRFFVKRHSGSGSRMSNLLAAAAEEKPEAPPSSGNVQLSDLREPINWKWEDIGAPGPERSLEHMALDSRMGKVVRDIKFWRSHQTWHRERGLTWRRGYLLYGKPGTGKTSLVRAIAEDLDMPVHIFDLASMNNSEFLGAWTRTKSSSTRIILLEDIDAVFNKRENISKHGELTFDTLLNVIDGVEREDGLVLFVTTNNIDAIDEALGTVVNDGTEDSTRPGRIDLVVELGGLDDDGRYKIAKRILQDEALAKKATVLGRNQTAAQFQERCGAQAKALLWEDMQ